MALFMKTLKRYRRIGTQNKYAQYLADKKVKGELKSALTLAQWKKAGKPMPKKKAIPKVKKYIKKKPKKTAASLLTDYARRSGYKK
jgi:hypothetical protein